MNAWMRVERALDRCCPPGANPLSHLGAIACLMFVLLLLSGIYLYVFFDTSVDGAWASVERLSRQPPGGWLRSLHRYAADLFLLSVWLHLLREAVLGRYTRFRRLSWLTGLVLLPLAYVSGVGGFWLAWDQLGQYTAIASAELLDALPLFSTSLSRNFLTPEAVNDRLFSLLIFVHLGVPLLMLFALWFHLQRITRPQLLPPRMLALALLSCLGILALAAPILSLPPADLGSVPATLPLDWWLLHWQPLAEAWGPALTWAVIGAMLLVLLLLPLRPQAPPPVALVDADNCNGCQRCVADCPYAAITLEAHPNGKLGRQIAVVAADRCASCGICAGSCPSATPFRSTELLVSGIDMPRQTIAALRGQLEATLAAHTDAAIVVFGCDHGANLKHMAAPGLIPLSLLCIGQLPPAFIEYALRAGAAGVLIVGCHSGGCAFRWGEALTAQRLSGQREPHLRSSVPGARWQMLRAGPGEEARVSAAALQLARLTHVNDGAGPVQV
ncbi:MAG: cytochrome b N-terminal domain-containing protein [Lysobacterales bacterium]